MERVVAAVNPTDAAAPVIALHDSLKHVDSSGRIVGAFEREGLALAQTPQAATLVVLRAALEESQAWGRKMTDEAAAFGAAGIVVRSVPGEAGNQKLTEPGDELLVGAVLAARALPLSSPAVAAGQRAGIGFDAHRFGSEGTLRLAGVEFRGESRLAGHSDGDAALHAVIDALLGAAAAGDVGSLYPPGDARWKDADSVELLRGAVATLRRSGWAPYSIDLTIVAEHPAIAPRRAEIAARLAEACGVDASAVGVKGTTSDGLGFTGAEGIAAFAVAVINRA
jgi:2-C-methyl-D-erythritol 4-phosphate cytidylyltransferase/2-C-methyl-D-erythritol 2,4-cyclodiphosphate synthase